MVTIQRHHGPAVALRPRNTSPPRPFPPHLSYMASVPASPEHSSSQQTEGPSLIPNPISNPDRFSRWDKKERECLVHRTGEDTLSLLKMIGDAALKNPDSALGKNLGHLVAKELRDRNTDHIPQMNKFFAQRLLLIASKRMTQGQLDRMCSDMGMETCESCINESTLARASVL